MGLVGMHGVGSNNWVVAPGLTTTGGALLANDPHLGISMPSIWYLNGLHCAPVTDACPYDVAGASFPGVPAVVLGHNARIAWGATNAGPGRPGPVPRTGRPGRPDPLPVRWRSRPFETRTEEIRGEGRRARPAGGSLTAHGPILNDVEERLADAPLMSLRWTGHRGEPGSHVRGDPRAQHGRARLRRVPREPLAVRHAEPELRLRRRRRPHRLPAAGHVPIRDGDATGLRPRPGDDGTHEWTGSIPFDDLPSELDPEAGTIVTANNAVVDASYPYYIADQWDPGFRAEQATDGLLARGEDGLTARRHDRAPGRHGPGPGAQRGHVADGGRATTDDGRLVLDRILEWDGACAIDSLGCAAWSMFEYRLHRDVFDDDLGPLARDYVGTPPAQKVIDALFDDPEAAWWDDTSTPDRETSPEIVARALDEAGSVARDVVRRTDQLDLGPPAHRDLPGGDGRLQRHRPARVVLQRRPARGRRRGRRPRQHLLPVRAAYPDPLDPDYVPVGPTGCSTVTNLPSMRFAIDMTDLDGARIVITTGQSGNPFDRHYNDMIGPWRNGETVPLPFTQAAIDEAAAQTLVLQP